MDALMLVHLVVIHVLAVPVALKPVLGSVLLNKIVDSVPEVIGFQQQQLDYEVTNLSFVVLVAAHRLDEEEPRSETWISSYNTNIHLYASFSSPDTG